MKPTQTVLLVDDIPEYLDTMDLNLPEACRAVRALSAEEARNRVADGVPAAVVVDIRLNEDYPENRDGLEFVKWMRTHYPLVPVIVISAYREFEYEAESLALGAECFLKKPIQPDEFREKLASVLRRS